MGKTARSHNTLLLGTGTEAGMPETRVIFLMNFIIALALKECLAEVWRLTQSVVSRVGGRDNG